MRTFSLQQHGPTKDQLSLTLPLNFLLAFWKEHTAKRTWKGADQGQDGENSSKWPRTQGRRCHCLSPKTACVQGWVQILIQCSKGSQFLHSASHDQNCVPLGWEGLSWVFFALWERTVVIYTNSGVREAQLRSLWPCCLPPDSISLSFLSGKIKLSLTECIWKLLVKVQ